MTMKTKTWMEMTSPAPWETTNVIILQLITSIIGRIALPGDNQPRKSLAVGDFPQRQSSSITSPPWLQNTYSRREDVKDSTQSPSLPLAISLVLSSYWSAHPCDNNTHRAHWSFHRNAFTFFFFCVPLGWLVSEQSDAFIVPLQVQCNLFFLVSVDGCSPPLCDVCSLLALFLIF